jgi:hypothetical protein
MATALCTNLTSNPMKRILALFTLCASVALAQSTGGIGLTPISRGGTGATNITDARQNLGFVGLTNGNFALSASGKGLVLYGNASVVSDASGNLVMRSANSSPALLLNQGSSGTLVFGNPTSYFSTFNLAVPSITDQTLTLRGTPDGAGYEHAKIVASRDPTYFNYASTLAFYLEGKVSGSTDTSGEVMKLSLDGTGTPRLLLGGTNGGTIKFPFAPGGTYIGYQAGQNAVGNGTYNTFVGYQSGSTITSGYNNAFVGLQTGTDATTAFANSAIGLQAMQHLTTGSFNSAVGIHALLSNQSGVSNNAVGAGAMEYGTTFTANNAFGMYAGRDNNGTANLFLGHHAGMNWTGDNALFIANTETAPLIFGDFAGKLVAIGGSTTPQAQLDVDGGFTAIRLKLATATDAWVQLRGTPDSTGFEYARVFSGRDTTSATYASYLAFYTESKSSGTTDTSTEKARVTAAGNLLVGVTTDVTGNGNLVASGALMPGNTAARWTSGSGSPEGVITAPVGSLYTRTNGGAGTTLYVKESGAGNTGWVAK